MKIFISMGLTIVSLAIVSAQDAARPAPSPDVEALRQQVQALTETVKALQQQVQDQQTKIDRMNQENAAANAEPSPIAGAVVSPSASPAASAPSQFPTEDTSVSSATTASPTPVEFFPESTPH